MSETNQQLPLFEGGASYKGFWNADQHPQQQWLFRELNGASGPLIDWETAAWLAPELVTVEGWVEASPLTIGGLKRMLDESSIPLEHRIEKQASLI
jgi:hypothetical protein